MCSVKDAGADWEKHAEAPSVSKTSANTQLRFNIVKGSFSGVTPGGDEAFAIMAGKRVSDKGGRDSASYEREVNTRH